MPPSRLELQLQPRAPWILRPFERMPPLAAAAAVSAAVFGAFLAWTALLGEAPARLPGLRGELNWIAEGIQDLFLGATLAVAAASVRAARRDFDALAPLLAPGVDRPGLRAEVFTWRPAPVWCAALACGLVASILTPLDPGLWEDGRFPGWAHPTSIWLALRNGSNWLAVGFAMALELALGSRFSRLGTHLGELDLLDAGVLAPFARRALRNVSWWMLLVAFLSLNYAGRGWAGGLLPLALGALGAFTLAAFLLPLLGAHRTLVERKAAELARVRAALREARERALAPGAEKEAGGRLADLVAYESRVAGVREWPLDASVVLRLLLFLGLGLGSWVGAALVDQLLERALR